MIPLRQKKTTKIPKPQFSPSGGSAQGADGSFQLDNQVIEFHFSNGPLPFFGSFDLLFNPESRKIWVRYNPLYKIAEIVLNADSSTPPLVRIMDSDWEGVFDSAKKEVIFTSSKH